MGTEAIFVPKILFLGLKSVVTQCQIYGEGHINENDPSLKPDSAQASVHPR